MYIFLYFQFMGDKQNAMRDYQEAVKLDETYSLAYFNAGNVYFHTRQFSQVNKHLGSWLFEINYVAS